MELAEIAFLCVALGLSVMVFRLASGNGWHWTLALFLALIPLGFTFFLGIIGLLLAGVFVGAAYKAAG
jgi:hypothetical protein